MKDERTYCPHCWTEVSKDDTTCHMCGEGIEHTPTDSGEYYHPVSSRYIWSLIFFIGGIIVAGWVSL